MSHCVIFFADGRYSFSWTSGHWASWLCSTPRRHRRFTWQLAGHVSTRRHSDIKVPVSSCQLRRRGRILDIDARKRLVCALKLTRIDYLAGLSDSTLAPLQRVLHAAAPVVHPRLAATGPHHSALQMLHWLPVRQRITYKLCVLMHGVAFRYAPTCLQQEVAPLATLPGRAHLRSADTGKYDTPRVSSSVSSRAFSVAGPQA